MTKKNEEQVEIPTMALTERLDRMELCRKRLFQAFEGLQSARERGAPGYEVRAFLTSISVNARVAGSVARAIESDLADDE